MKPRFQADNDLRNAIRYRVLRREPSIDFRSAPAANLHRLPDPEVLRLAAIHNRILVSHDENSMPAHFRDFLNAGIRSPGLLIIPQRIPVADVIESLLIIWSASDAAEWIDRLAWLPL